MFFKVQKVITKFPPPLEEIKLYLQCCFRDLEPLLAHADTITDVLHLIEVECTLIHIEPLQDVVEEFELSEAKRYIEEYKTKMEKFCQTVSIQLCLKENFEVTRTRFPLQCETATYVFDWEPNECMLKDIKDILSKASGKLVKIKYIDTIMSISVTCTFPYYHLEEVISTSLKNLDLLRNNGLMELTVGYRTIWKASVQKVSSLRICW